MSRNHQGEASAPVAKHLGPTPKWVGDIKAQAIETILGRIATSRDSILTICEAEDLPDAATFFAWKRNEPNLDREYARAKEDQADFIAEEMMDIADDGRNDWMEKRAEDGSVTGYQLNGEHVQRSKLRIETMKWTAGKLRPKRYGDFARTELSGPNGGPIELGLAEALQAARKRSKQGRSVKNTAPERTVDFVDATDTPKLDENSQSDDV